MYVVHRGHVQVGYIYIWVEGKKYYVLTKRVKKKHYCLIWDFPMTYQIKGGKWVILYCDCSVDSFYYDIVGWVYTAGTTTATTVYIWGGG